MSNNNNWIQTYTGRQFFPANPSIEDIDIRDIAVSLSRQNRYTGHTKKPYSVAQHCVIMSQEINPKFAKEALLHDAAEAYISDISSPVRQYLPVLDVMEERILEAIVEKFRLDFPFRADIWVADLRMVATEKRDLMGPCHADWNLTVKPYSKVIIPVGPNNAEEMFMQRFEELFGSAEHYYYRDYLLERYLGISS